METNNNNFDALVESIGQLAKLNSEANVLMDEIQKAWEELK